MAADIIDLKDRMKNTADKKTVAEKVQDLKEAYALISPLTNLPYVECEQENFFDQVLLYETKEDADNFVAPAWFTRDVSMDGAYHNSALSSMNEEQRLAFMTGVSKLGE